MSQRGLTVSELLERLREKKRGKGRLPPAQPRSTIGVSTATAYPTAATAGGIRSPLTEQSRTYYTDPSYITSSNGFFVIEYFPMETCTFLDDAQQQVVVIYNEEPE